MIRQLHQPEEKQVVARAILTALPEWFGIPEAREDYIRRSASQPCFAAYEEGTPVGFLCLEETGCATVEVYVMGVVKRCHHQGIGTALFLAAKAWAAEQGYAFMQVKTVQEGRYPEYDATNAFYRHLGFQEFEVFPTLWDEWNPCQVYVLSLR